MKSDDFHDYPFTREEFAVSTATYLDKISANAPEDPFVRCALQLPTFHTPALNFFPRERLPAHTVMLAVMSPSRPSHPTCLGRCTASGGLRRIDCVVVRRSF